jgi:hypothetical protein
VTANSSIAIGDPEIIGAQIYTLQVPTKGSPRAYAPAGTWVWSSFTPNGSGPSSVPGHDTYTRWNTIRDMGDGRQAIIVCSNINAAHVYKVPAAGL